MPKKSLINVKYFIILLLFLFTVSGLSARNAALLYNSNLDKHSYANKELQKWEYLLLKWGINYNLVSLDDFSGSDIDEYSFAIGLALQTASLSEFRELSEFVANGGSLILDSSVFGPRNAGIITNADFWTNNFSMEINEFEKGNSRLVLSFDTPISQNGGGYRFPVRKYNVSFLPTAVNIFSAGFFENADNKAGLVYGMLDSGKIVWFGIDVDFFSLNNKSSEHLKTVVKNSFDWLMGKPQIWVNRLPGNYSSAVSFVCDVSSNSLGAFKAVQFFQKENIRPTFVLQPEKKYDKKLLNEFVRTGEIAFNFDDVLSGERAGISGKFYSAIKEFKKNNRIIKFRAVKGVQLGGVDLLNAIKNEKRVPFEYVIANQKASNYSYEIFDN
ncbi:MAG: hypothetical protein GXO87_04965, partial [Chlorobi bacterium]|nr:hypothetical protein [Chlorobiota bacterium]